MKQVDRPYDLRAAPTRGELARSLAALLLITAVGGCATLQQGQRQPIRVGFFGPETVRVTADSVVCGTRGIAPVDCDVSRRHSHLIRAQGAGLDTSVVVTPHVNWYWVRKDLFTLGIGWIVDAITGAWYDLSPDTIERSQSGTR